MKHKGKSGVYDSEKSKFVNHYDRAADATKLAKKLNTQAGDLKEENKFKWEVNWCELRDPFDYLLDEGFEPFSVSDGIIYFKRYKKK